MRTHLTKYTAISADSALASDRTVRGYASVWGVIDSQGDRTVRGAFSKAVDAVKAGAVIPVLWQHESDDLPIGKIVELEEDDTGLRFVAKLSDTTAGEDTLRAVMDQTVRQVSVAGWMVRAEQKPDAQDVLEVELEEISLCTWGANSQTSVHKTSLYQAAETLAAISELKGGFERLSRLLSSSESFGPQASEAVVAALDSETMELQTWIKAQFKTLNGSK